MAKFPAYEEFTKKVAEKALDEFLYNGKSIREWMQIIVSEDCISRQSVEEMIKTEMPERGMWEIEGDKEKETVCEVCVDLMQKLSELPPVNSQSKTGHWFNIDGNSAVCSCCNRNNILYGDFCKWCGTKMQAESNIKQGLNYADEDTLMPAT